ncbi:uncharacterized protein LOC128256833 [Drosophila gunungcola]|uniref:uncharacterized protein LOC128256833 n=1 Tax=Drosophila gunungcola TaxID=103775 RepID=UPI0022E1626C|nr:uncharacterized protein LOC128256833 [Drosophila gunungcola]
MRISGATTEFSGLASTNTHPQSPHKMEQLQPGDACLECLGLGRNHKLRFFYINLEEQLLKCESRSCLWPHNDEVSSDEELDLNAGDPLPAIDVAENPPFSGAAPLADRHPPCAVLLADPPPPCAVALADPPPDDDDEFILQLLQQLTPGTETDSVESPPESNINLCSVVDLLSLDPTEVTSCPQLELPDLSFLEENIPEHKEPLKAVITKQEIPLLPAKLKSPPRFKTPKSIKIKEEGPPLKIPSSQVKQEVTSLNISAVPNFQSKLEIPLLPASLKTLPRIKPKGDPFSTPLKKASTQPQTQPPIHLETPPAVNIIISIPELNPAVPFLDAIKRHSTGSKPSLRGGGRRPKRLARETTGRGIRTQAVMHLIERLETTADAKRLAPPP